MKTNNIRSAFTHYFHQQQHTVRPSSPLVPKEDPTLLFTTAGMVQFKNYFTGVETPTYTRATTVQKCVRAGGKHNDLENVGYTARHHTFFEMLGNFSFGDYFKEEAIPFAWEFLTKVVGLAPEKLLVTVYHTDEEAVRIWKKVTGFSDDKIIRIATSDNFWSMGDEGPCGPCTEIFYDHGPNVWGGPPGSAEEDGDRFMEIWNLVFMQYEQYYDADGKHCRRELPSPSIDTGMGLERLATVLQGVNDNYDIDLFQNLIKVSTDITGVAAVGDHKPSHKVIADHLRSGAFLIADGVLPSNEGRGYVLRRILRRAMRHVHKLGYEDLLLHKMVTPLITEMGDAYPELKRAEAAITETLRGEEDKFHTTLRRGMGLLKEEMARVAGGGQLPGEVAFKLYDTYGFPVDLTQDILRGEQKTLDVDGFEAAMEKQREEAKASWVGSGAAKQSPFWLALSNKLGPTMFLGYESEHGEGVIEALVKDEADVTQAKQGDEVQVVLNASPFYGESGGQMGDAGFIKAPEGVIEITDTQKLNDMHIHFGRVTEGFVNVNDQAHLTVNRQRREGLRAHHSATHLVHAALRKVLGEHVVQKGSLVAPDKLRFDFTHNGALTLEERLEVEGLVNHYIRHNKPVQTVVSTPEEAMEKGAMALFGEKYGDNVRVVSMGIEGDDAFSLELCGGTHVHATGDIGYFKITDESSVAAGVRRIEAVAGAAAHNYVEESFKQLHNIGASLKVPANQAIEKIETLKKNLRDQETQIQGLRLQLARGGSSAADQPEDLGNGMKLLHKKLQDVPTKDLRSILDDMKKNASQTVILISATNDGKVSLLVGVTSDLTLKVQAANLIKELVPYVGGKGGGGRADFAQGGGNDAGGIEAASAHLKKLLQAQ